MGKRQHFQVAFSALVNGRGTNLVIDPSTSVFTWHRSGTLPYTVPNDLYLGLSTVHFGSKHVNEDGDTRSSYLVIPGVVTVTEYGPTVNMIPAFVVPPGKIIEANFWNNSPEHQWMNGFITGWLVKDPNLL